jgi:uncharacterized protein YydD (DUF2326 family)
LNLIVDETPIDLLSVSRESGNNVGKTTVLRLVSYCFGADAKKIYQDPEFEAKQDPAVKPYLENNNVIIEINLTRNLAFGEESDIVIERNFLKRRDKIQRINGQSFSDDDFARELKVRLFDSAIDKPTVKQIVAKSIREGNLRTENAIHVLDPFAQAVEYEALFLFWLGIPTETMSDKQRLEQQAKTERALLVKLRRDASESQISQALRVLDRTIRELEKRRDAVNVNPDYQQDLEALNAVRQKVMQLSARLGALELRQQLLADSIAEFRQERSTVDAELVGQLYREAHALIPGLQRTFAETLAFHNRMVVEREAYLTRELPGLEADLRHVQHEAEAAKQEEARLVDRVSTSDSFEAIELVNADLREAYRQRGQYEESQRVRTQTQATLESLVAELSIINEGIGANRGIVEQRIASFNEIFSRLSHDMYSEQFILSSDWSKDKLNLVISSVGDGPGTGKKLGQIALFDLSYIRFSDELGIPALHFVMQDRMEQVHGNQLRTLSNIIKTSNCQYIVTMLRDKVPEEMLAAGTVVLRLSQEDKLFRLP